MARNVVSAEAMVDAPADRVYLYLADMRDHHPRFLPPAFSDFQVESGGVGAGTVTRFKITAGGRTRDYRMKVSKSPKVRWEPRPCTAYPGCPARVRSSIIRSPWTSDRGRTRR